MYVHEIEDNFQSRFYTRDTFTRINFLNIIFMSNIQDF